MSDVDFNAILDMPVEEIKARPPLPIGTYDWRILKTEPFTSSQKKTPGVQFTVVPYAVVDGVDEDALAESGGLEGVEKKLDFYITPEASPRLKEFLIEHVKIDGQGKTLRQLIAESINQGFRGIVGMEVSQKGRTYSAITQTLAIE